MIDPLSLGASAACGAAAAFTYHQRFQDRNTLEELQRHLNLCLSLRTTSLYILVRQRKQHPQELASSSKLDRSVTVLSPEGSAELKTHRRLGEIADFLSYIIENVKRNQQGAHWEWLRTRDNIDQLRAELLSIQNILAVACANARLGDSHDELSKIYQAIQGMSLQWATSSLPGAKIDNHCASHQVSSQLYKENQQAERKSTSCQWPRVQAIEAPNHSESETCPIVQDPSSFWPEGLLCPCIGQSLLSALAIALSFGRICSSIRTCYMLVALGLFSIAGSLALALWRTIKDSDIQGGFSVAQYILAVGGMIIACVLVLHSRTCSCWSSPSSTGGNGTPPEGRPIELQQPGGSDSSARPTAESLV